MAAVIEHSKILIVEGNDENIFFECFIEKFNLNTIQIMKMDGKDKLSDTLKLIKSDDGYDDLISLAVFRDADNDANGAFQSVRDCLQNNGFPVPDVSGGIDRGRGISVGIYIIPGHGLSGMLETIVLNSVDDNNLVKKYSLEYISKLEGIADLSPNNLHKARVYAYLAGMKKYIPSVGIAAKKGYFNLEHACFHSLKTFLSDL